MAVWVSLCVLNVCTPLCPCLPMTVCVHDWTCVSIGVSEKLKPPEMRGQSRHTWDRRRSAAQRGENLVSTHLKHKSSLFMSHVWVKSFFVCVFFFRSTEQFSVWCLSFQSFPSHSNTKCVFSLTPDSLTRIFTSVMTCFLDQEVPGLGPAHWSWTIWNLCLSALGMVPCVQSHCSELKPSSSVPNNDWTSNVLTPALTHRPSCSSVPACINRSVYSRVRTSFLWSPLRALNSHSLGPVR